MRKAKGRPARIWVDRRRSLICPVFESTVRRSGSLGPKDGIRFTGKDQLLGTDDDSPCVVVRYGGDGLRNR